MKVAALQLCASDDPTANLDMTLPMVQQAAEMGATQRDVCSGPACSPCIGRDIPDESVAGVNVDPGIAITE